MMSEGVMRRYYLLMDYIVPIFSDLRYGDMASTGPRKIDDIHEKQNIYKELQISPSKTKRLFKVESDVILYTAFCNVDIGHFVIGSTSRRKAYQLATIIRAYFSLFWGWQPDDRSNLYFLQELTRLPQPDWDKGRVVKEIATIDEYAVDPLEVMLELKTGYQISYRSIINLPDFIQKVWEDSDLIEALDHLLESRFLFCGYMVGSYYNCHYKKDRQEVPKWEMEKRYYENRYRYETAFVAAFKGIERFFCVNQIKKKNLERILQKRVEFGIHPETEYKRYYEIFSGHAERITYKELICHFLDIRNTVAAHGNSNPPEHAKLIEDNVYEIQHFLVKLLDNVLSK